MKTYKFRIYPNRNQEQVLEQTIETCRLLYNESLQERRENKLKRLSYYEQKKLVTQKRNTIESLKHIHSQVLQNVLLRLERAFQNFHRDRKIGQPRFKRHGRYNSITYPQYGGFQIKENRLKLSFVNGLIKIKMHRIPVGTLKTCTIIKDIDRWFACITTTTTAADNTTKTKNATNDDNHDNNANSTTIVGVDVGLLNWITLSNGHVIDRPKFLYKSMYRIKQLQMNLSHRKKGSRNRSKARILLAKAWRKVKLQREDYCHKVSNDLTKNYKTIVFEKLSIRNMTKNHNLAASILDATWYKLKQLAAYKAEADIIEVESKNTTQRCSRCGSLSQVKKDLSERIYECSNCGLIMDRDHNAALNILKLGQELANVERKPILVSPTINYLVNNRRTSKLLSMKQEAHDLSHG
jgi:putative transposase